VTSSITLVIDCDLSDPAVVQWLQVPVFFFHLPIPRNHDSCSVVLGADFVFFFFCGFLTTNLPFEVPSFFENPTLRLRFPD